MVRDEVKAGAYFSRGRKHGKLHLPNGRLFVVATSPSDRRAYLNARTVLRTLKRPLGVSL